MDKVYVIYWSQTGNTQAMADAIGAGITAGGKEACIKFVTEVQAAELSVPEVGELLEEYGYADCNICNCICRLKQRLTESVCFPHEIGVFLGYNLEDVRGFIDNNGKDCKACGLWKVYCNEGEKEKLFEKFNRCTRIYT